MLNYGKLLPVSVWLKNYYLTQACCQVCDFELKEIVF